MDAAKRNWKDWRKLFEGNPGKDSELLEDLTDRTVFWRVSFDGKEILSFVYDDGSVLSIEYSAGRLIDMV